MRAPASAGAVLGWIAAAAASAGAWMYGAEPAAATAESPQIEIVDQRDAASGLRVRQLRKDDGHEHNLYYSRNPWNADGSRFVAIHSDLDQKNWRVALCDGDGRFLKYLFTPAEYDWRIVWDRHDPDVLYTTRATSIVRFRVSTGKGEVLTKLSKPLRPTGVSLNQKGDRILVATADWTFHSFALPGMTDERTFRPAVPKDYNSDKPAYTGHRDTVHVNFTDGPRQGILVYTDTGELVHEFKDIGGGGHFDFLPDGKLAYFKMPPAGTGNARALEIHVVNLDGSDDRIVFRAAAEKMRFVQNLHVSWPDNVSDRFVASLFPNASNLPPAYAPLLDEILMIKLDGTHRVLARSQTAHSRAAGRGQAGDMFWAQPLASPSADGRRIAFNSNRSGTVDSCILYVEPAVP